MTKIDFLIIQRNYLTVVYSEIPFSKNLYHIEIIQLICQIIWLVSIWYKILLKGISEVYKTVHYFQASSSLQLIYYLLASSFWYRKYSAIPTLWIWKKEQHLVSKFTSVASNRRAIRGPTALGALGGQRFFEVSNASRLG